MLPDKWYSSRHFFEPVHHYLFKAFDVRLRVAVRASQTNLIFPFISEVVEWVFFFDLQYNRNHRQTHSTLAESFDLSLDWHLNTRKCTYWSFPVQMPSSTTVSKCRQSECTTSCSFSHRRCLTDSNILYSRQNRIKRRSCTKLKNIKWRKFTYRTLYIGKFTRLVRSRVTVC